jgi:hypothetical protein
MRILPASTVTISTQETLRKTVMIRYANEWSNIHTRSVDEIDRRSVRYYTCQTMETNNSVNTTEHISVKWYYLAFEFL